MPEEFAFGAISTVGGGEVCRIGAVARREGEFACVRGDLLAS